MLRRVKIADPEVVAKRYPHQLSGGMQQRVTIAMALSTQPRLLILDEPTTALDVTTQAVIVDLFRDLIRDNQAAALYVSHDLGLVAQLCDRVTVLYGGEIMASAPVVDLYKQPLHPYTISLLASLPRPTEGVETRLPTIEGVAPSLAERPPACVFAPRCPVALAICHEVKPPLETIGDGRLIKCHRWREIADGSLVIDTAPKEAASSAPPREGYVLASKPPAQVFRRSLADGSADHARAGGRPRGRRRVAAGARPLDARLGRRERQRQDHSRPPDRRLGDRRQRRARPARPAAQSRPEKALARRPARLADGLPEPERRAQPVHDHRAADRPDDSAPQGWRIKASD